MSSGFCTVCGAVLRDGVCPRGHPQRATRRIRRRRQLRGPITILILIVLLAAGSYLALYWYPERAASALMRPSSAEFEEALASYRAAAQALPPAATDPSVLVNQASAVLESADGAREELSSSTGSLEAREPIDVPVVSSRPPLDQAIDLRDRMLAYYTGALEVIADVESVAGYITEIAGVLPQLDNLQGALDDPADIGQAVAAATPIADQMIADLEALTPPEELGALHSSLLAIARRMRANLDEIAGAGQAGTAPVVTALINDVRGDVATFRETVGSAPDLARQAGLGIRLEALEAQAQRIIDGLRSLRDDQGVSGLTVPE